MFPETETEYEETITTSEEATLGLTPLYDFDKNEYVLKDGKIVYCTNEEAAAQWLGFLVKTEMDKYKVYEGTEFGTYIENYIGYKDKAFVFSEIKREIQEKAALNEAIASVDDFEMEREKDRLIISMAVTMNSGETEEVNVSV